MARRKKAAAKKTPAKKAPTKKTSAKKTPAKKAGRKPAKIDALRRKIDSLDRQLVQLLNDRADAAIRIGEIKRDGNTPIYSPHREHAVMQHVARLNKGPLPPHVLQAVYREIISGSYALEQPLKIAFLGPEGTFSHQAALRSFGLSVEYRPMPTIQAIFEEVARKHCALGVVPIENTLGGGVVDTLDCFAHFSVPICDEILLEVHHNLLAKCAVSKVKRIYSRPEVFSQCRKWLSDEFRDAELVPMDSSARAAQMAARHANTAALGSELAGQVHGLRTLFRNVEDTPHNMTRFLVLGQEPARRTGHDRTAMMFTTRHKSGALADVLKVFSRHGVNLSSIDSRPTRRRNWAYYFFIEAEGHMDDAAMIKAVASARQHCGELHILGSFPRAARPV